MVSNGMTRSIGSFFSLKRIALIVALAVLLRAAVVALNSEEVLQGSYNQNQYTFFVLPALELLALLMAAVSMKLGEKRDGAARAGITVLMVVMINAVLRVVDFARLHGPCEEEEVFRVYESLCEPVFAELMCNAPFLLLGTVVLLIWRARRTRGLTRELN